MFLAAWLYLSHGFSDRCLANFSSQKWHRNRLSELGVSHHKHPSYVYCTICQGWFILSRALPRRGSMGFRQQLLD